MGGGTVGSGGCDADISTTRRNVSSTATLGGDDTDVLVRLALNGVVALETERRKVKTLGVGEGVAEDSAGDVPARELLDELLIRGQHLLGGDAILGGGLSGLAIIGGRGGEWRRAAAAAGRRDRGGGWRAPYSGR